MDGLFWPKRKGTSLWQAHSSNLRHKAKGSHFIASSSSLHNFLRSDEWQHLHMSSLFIPQQHDAAKKQKYFTPSSGIKHKFIYYAPTSNQSTSLHKTKQRDDDEQEIEALLLWNDRSRLVFDSRSLRSNLLTVKSAALLQQTPDSRSSQTPKLQCMSHFATNELQCLLARYNTRQFIGTQQQYDFLLQYHDFHFDTRNYWIMVRKSSNLQAIMKQMELQHGECKQLDANKPPDWAILPPNLRVKRLAQAHFAQLLPLEHAYYAEEVILGPLSPNIERALEKQCYERLKQYIQYGIFSGKELLSRVMVNSYGLYYWQIGGIYTVPQCRGQGLANLLLQKLCQSIEQAGRIAMLFVRRENSAALNLYKKNGFNILERMVIAQENIT